MYLCYFPPLIGHVMHVMCSCHAGSQKVRHLSHSHSKLSVRLSYNKSLSLKQYQSFTVIEVAFYQPVSEGYTVTFLKRAHVMLDYSPCAPPSQPRRFWQNKCWAFFSSRVVRSYRIFYFYSHWLLLASSQCCTVLTVKHTRVLFHTWDETASLKWQRGEKHWESHCTCFYSVSKIRTASVETCEGKVIQGVQLVFAHILILLF